MENQNTSLNELSRKSRVVIWLLLINAFLLVLWFSLPEKPKPVKEDPETLVAEEELDSLSIGSLDPNSGLVIDKGYQLILQNCQACHNIQLVTQNYFTRDVWLEKIRWMQAKQNLWDLGENENPILDYLAKHYNPAKKLGQKAEGQRRQNLNVEDWYALD